MDILYNDEQIGGQEDEVNTHKFLVLRTIRHN